MDESIQQLIDRFNETHRILRMDEIERLRRVEQQNKRLKNVLLLLLDCRSVVHADVRKEIEKVLNNG